MKSSKNGLHSSIAWHPAFIEALQMELEAYSDILEFHPEYQLTSEPLKIDCIIIKKARDIVIKKNIAAIFKEVNLVEYKSPDDYVSILDFYKVYAYACLYAAFEKIPITSITISFIESRYPKELVTHLKEIRGFLVEKTKPGIYTVRGDILPIQIIDNRQLGEVENLWLRGLSKRLDTSVFNLVTTEAARQGKAARIGAYLYAITQANPQALQEVMKMNGSKLTFEKVLEDAGLIAKWEARGRAEGEAKGRAEGEVKGRFDIAQQMVNSGFPFETVVSMTKLDPEKVRELYSNNN